MINSSTECLPEALAFEPWFDLYFGATFCPDCFEGRLRRIDAEPVERRGDAWAVASRAYARIGRPGEALRAWDRAMNLGGPEVESLSIWLLGDGVRRAEARAEGLRDPGLRADAWCDVAALHVSSRSMSAALAALGEAVNACPDHGEALHWLRFLAMPDAAKAITRVQQKPSRRGDGVTMRDALALLPLRANGWVSPERLDRRALMEPPVEVVPGSALAALRAAGVPQTFLATEPDWARVPDRHPLVRAELDLDRLASVVREGRPALTLAHEAWNAARASGDALRVDDVAQLLCALGTQEQSLVRLAREAARWLIETHNSQQVLFTAYAAWFSAVLEERGAGEEASRLLGLGVEDDLAWRLLVGALYRAGNAEAGRAELDRVGLDLSRRALAHSLRRANACADAPVVALSPRLVRRDLAALRPVALA